MRQLTAAMAVALVLLSACSGSGDGSLTTGDGAAITVAGADAGIEGEGDAVPEGEEDQPTVVSVTVDAPDGADLAGLAVIALEDVSMADAPSVEIARIEVPALQLAENPAVELFVPLPLDGSVDITASVHIDTDESGSVSQGDWISAGLVPVGPGATEVTVAIVPF